MFRRDGKLIISPSDLVTFFESPFASWMDRQRLEVPNAPTPDPRDDMLSLLAEYGAAHERRYLEGLRQAGVPVFMVDPTKQPILTTTVAMRGGHPVIYSAVLSNGMMEGQPDLLARYDVPSRLGQWGYLPADCKLGRSATTSAVIQLCAYADLLEHAQGVRPPWIRVVAGSGEIISLPTDDYFAYYLRLKDDFLAAHESFDSQKRPPPEGKGDHGRWSRHADEWLERADDLSRVANITRLQIRRLRKAGVATLGALAESSTRRVNGVDESVLLRLREQAALQVMSAGAQRPRYEVLNHKAGERRGLSLLPPPSENDVFFDMEGFPPSLLDGGLEYLFGAQYLKDGLPSFFDLWAHDVEAERRAFDQFVDWIHSRFEADRSMHVYHYGNYEIAALRRLMGKFATREEKVDALLRAEVFVDLFKVVRQGLRVGGQSYSLKVVERLYRAGRASDVATAVGSVVEYARWRAAPDGQTWQTSATLRSIRDYNQDDCDSLRLLGTWLRERQRESGIPYQAPRPKDTESSSIPAWQVAESMAARLLAAIPEDRTADPERWRLQELLAHLVTFHRRESKPIFWARYDRREATPEELVDDPDCLGNVRRTERPPLSEASSYLYEYEFDPDQDTSLIEGRRCFMVPNGFARATVHAIDHVAGRVVLKIGETRDEPPETLSLIPNEFIDPDPLVLSIRRTAEAWEGGRQLPRNLDDLLRRSRPRLRSGYESSLLRQGEEPIAGVERVLLELDESYLVIQGPPGTGKTHAAATAIAGLVAKGKRVAVTANSHSVIEHLLERIAAAATAKRETVRLAKVGKDRSGQDKDLAGVVRYAEFGDIDFGASEAPSVVGGTAWALSSPEASGRFDFLFVEEAGQVSLANVTATAPCARNVVLLGDQMQLSQPTRGSHPGESGKSALGYLVGDLATVPPDRGVFLPRTKRLHPRLCSFVSSAFYEGRLEADSGTIGRTLRSRSGSRSRLADVEAGYVFVPSAHEGNLRSSAEEASLITALVSDLKAAELVENGQARPLTTDDIIVVAPYNLQVRELKQLLPGLQVGTVDKFQGRQATVVIVSMCTSAGEDTPRGLEFLFDSHRINVAVSRATTLAVIVAHPGLARTKATALSQMRRVNVFARLIREGARLEFAPEAPPKVAPLVSAQPDRRRELVERPITVTASNTHWGVDEPSVRQMTDNLQAPPASREWFELRREAERVALTPGFDSLITLDCNAIKELPHQISVAMQVLNRPMSGRAILADEVGLGKTIEAGIVLKELLVRGLARRILIVTPAALVEQWREELALKFFEKFDTPREPSDWEVMNKAVVSYDRARNHGEAILQHRWDLVVLDEAHKVKNHETQTYRFLQQVERNFILLLTATPLQNSLRELYNLVTLLRPGQLGTWRDFRRQYVLGGDPRKAKNPEALRELTSQVMVRTRRANVATHINLPPRKPRHPRVELTPEEMSLYRETTGFLRELYKRGFFSPDEAEEEADRVRRKRYTGKGNLSRIMMMLCQRLCSSSAALADSLENLSGGELVLPEYRTRARALAERARAVRSHAKLEILSQLISSVADRLIVFTEHVPTLRLIEARVKELGRTPIVFEGAVPRPERNQRLRRFRETERSVFLTTRAGAEGLNLQFCNYLVNYELPWNPMVVEQRIGRVHRIGQEREVHIINLASVGTIEAHVLRLLDQKIKLFELVVGELDVILGSFGEPDDVEKQLTTAWLASKSDEDFEQKVEEIGKAISASREEGLLQEQATSEIAAEDSGARLEQEFHVLTVAGRVRLGYGTVHLRIARGVEAKRHQLGLRVPEIIEALDNARASDGGRHPDYGPLHRLAGETRRQRPVSLLVKAESLPMLLVDLDAEPEAPLPLVGA